MVYNGFVYNALLASLVVHYVTRTHWNPCINLYFHPQINWKSQPIQVTSSPETNLFMPWYFGINNVPGHAMFSGETRWNNTTKWKCTCRTWMRAMTHRCSSFHTLGRIIIFSGLSLPPVSLVHKHVKMSVGKWIWKLVHTNVSKFLRTIF